MPFFRQKGDTISLVHGVPGPDGLEQRLLHTFDSREQLSATLADGIWASFCMQVEQRHPEVAPDWNEVRGQGLRLLGQPEPSPSAPTKLKRAMRFIQRELSRHGIDSPEGKALLASVWPEMLANLQLQLVLLERARGEELSEAMEMASTITPDPVEVQGILEAAREAAARRQWRRAAELFEMARAEDPYDPDIDNCEGLAWLERADFAKAEKHFSEARELARIQLPKGDGVYRWSNHAIRPYLRATFNLGLCYEMQARNEEALAMFLDCLQHCPEDGVSARFHLGPLYQRQGKLETALRRYREDLTGNLINLPDPYFDGASVLVALNRLPEAVEWILRGTAINVHFLRILTTKHKKSRAEEFTSPETYAWANAYADGHRDLWSEEGVALLKQVRRQPEVQHLVQSLALAAAEIEHDQDMRPHRRQKLADQIDEMREQLRSPEFAALIVSRITKASPKPKG